MKEMSLNPVYKTMWKVECELNEQLKQQLESLEKENRGLKMMLNHVAGVEHVCEDLEVKLAEAVEVIEFYGKYYKSDNTLVDFLKEEKERIDNVWIPTGKRARQFLAKYRGEK